MPKATADGRPRIYPCIRYARQNVHEAAEFYISVFPSFCTIPAKSPDDDRPDGPLGDMTLAEFTLFDRLFQVIQAEEGLWFSDAFSLTVLCDDQQELDRYWNAFIKADATPQRIPAHQATQSNRTRHRHRCRAKLGHIFQYHPNGRIL